ncbi:hypothetical protein CDL15_Pgr008330 [Punica granatum]|uniref:Uncharacterized protein n=1 Tax=Punica granatum TaxID=22663 RepID=A0A218XSH3_PUNGR|nr:hypothetical protein CDL15_Pgr008330 [Punica granatum]
MAGFDIKKAAGGRGMSVGAGGGDKGSLTGWTADACAGGGMGTGWIIGAEAVTLPLSCTWVGRT